MMAKFQLQILKTLKLKPYKVAVTEILIRTISIGAIKVTGAY